MQKHISGIAMIEVLISIGLISLVLLSLLSYQIEMFKAVEEVSFNNIASAQLINFSEMLLINKTDSARDKALSKWNKDNQNLLPQGEGQFNETDDHICDIQLTWFFKKEQSLSAEVYC